MLFKLDDNSQAINTDYIVSAYVRLHEGKWLVMARMIDGNMIGLSEHLSEETARVVYDKLIASHNERSKVLPADDKSKYPDIGFCPR